jgi:hypothetical protein
MPEETGNLWGTLERDALTLSRCTRVEITSSSGLVEILWKDPDDPCFVVAKAATSYDGGLNFTLFPIVSYLGIMHKARVLKFLRQIGILESETPAVSCPA